LYAEWKASTLDARSDSCRKLAGKYSPANVIPLWEEAVKQIEGVILDESTPVVVPAMEMKKVAIVTTWDTQCGIATYSRMLAEGLLEAGIEVCILAEVEDPSEITSEPIHTHDDDRIDVYRCWSRGLPIFQPLIDSLVSSGAQVVHLQHEWAIFKNTMILQAISGQSVKRVVTWHTPDSNAIEDFGGGIDELVDLHISHWEETTHRIADMPPLGVQNAVATVKHGIMQHTLTRSDARAQLGIPSKVPIIFSFGFSNAAKGTHSLIEAAIEAASDPALRYFEVVISAGAHPKLQGGDYIEHLTELVQGHDFITLIPRYLTEEEVDLYAASSDVLAFPYSWWHPINSCSGAIRRTLGHGKPVITTTEGRSRDLYGGIHGWKIGQFDKGGLVMAIKDAVSTIGSPMYEKYSENVLKLSEQDSWLNVAKQHVGLYQQICAVESWFVPFPFDSPFLQLSKKHLTSTPELGAE
jgi:glycosyltransferase involved in cell wall biosynthesis